MVRRDVHQICAFLAGSRQVALATPQSTEGRPMRYLIRATAVYDQIDDIIGVKGRA